MNMEDLKKMKAQLEKEISDIYVIVDNIEYLDVNDFNPMTKEEILSAINTNDKIKTCEYYFEESTKLLIKNYINFDTIGMFCIPGVVCRKEFYDELKYLDDLTDFTDSEQESRYLEKLRELPSNVLPDVIPITFLPNTSNDNADDLIINYFSKTLPINPMSGCSLGLVKFNEFISKLAELGYHIHFNTSSSITSYNDYLQFLIDNPATVDISFDITADFINEKEEKPMNK